MRITHKLKHEDPAYPIMHGDTPMAKEFNKRQEKLWSDGKFETFDFEQVSTMILEILCDDYNGRHASRKRKKEEVIKDN